MARIMILNGSPRAPRSNSKKYAALFAQACPAETVYREITRGNHGTLCREIEGFSDLLLVFPLYADGIPVTLLRFLKALEAAPPSPRLTVSMMVNCGFLEPGQNDIAVEMVRLFCEKSGCRFGSVLEIGSGEAILETPFAGMVRRKIGKLADSIARGTHRSWKVTMPLPKRWFIRASTAYWESYGKRNGVTKEQMATMEIEK